MRDGNPKYKHLVNVWTQLRRRLPIADSVAAVQRAAKLEALRELKRRVDEYESLHTWQQHTRDMIAALEKEQADAE